jgi:prolipoprotein diacylglyceryltransferase
LTRRIYSILIALSTIFMCAVTRAQDSSDYETVSLAARETVNGKTLVIIAYAVIFVLLSAYVWSILHRERNVQKSLRSLMNSIKSKK